MKCSHPSFLTSLEIFLSPKLEGELERVTADPVEGKVGQTPTITLLMISEATSSCGRKPVTVRHLYRSLSGDSSRRKSSNKQRQKS